MGYGQQGTRKSLFYRIPIISHSGRGFPHDEDARWLYLNNNTYCAFHA